MKKLLRRHRWMAALLLPLAALGADVATAQKLSPLNELIQAVGDRALPFADLEGNGALVGCSTVPAADLQTLSKAEPGANFQWMNDSGFVWQVLSLSGGRCVYLLKPETRGLTRDEARYFLSAQELPFPVANPRTHEVSCEKAAPPAAALQYMPTFGGSAGEAVIADIPLEQPAPGSFDPCAGGGGIGEEPTEQLEQKAGSTPGLLDSRQRLTRTGYPYNSVALTSFRGPVFSSAVQISPYVYATAAHVVLQPGGVRPREQGGVYPSYRIPRVTDKLPAAVLTWHAAYTNTPQLASDLQWDLAFIKVTERNDLALYPKFYFIRSLADLYYPNYNNIGDPNADIFYQYFPGIGHSSWFQRPLVPGIYTETITVGYPNFVHGSANRNNEPYFTIGNLSSVYGWQLLHVGSSTRVWKNSGLVSPGNSGGPVFGHHLGGFGGYTLLGVVSSAYEDNDINGGSSWTHLGSGHMDVTDGFMLSNMYWTPGQTINITAPVNGQQYPANAIPTFDANAGSNTSQLKWYSDVDGYLGSGGTLSVSTLSLGMHKITCKFGPEQMWQSGPATGTESPSKNSSGGIRVMQIEILPAVPHLSADPNPVVVPPGQASEVTWLTWQSPVPVNIDIYRKVGLSKVKLLDNAPASGTLPADVFVRKDNEFQIYAHGNTTDLLKSITVYGKPQPWFKAEPPTVLIPADAQTGKATISWGDFDGAVRLLVSVDGAVATEVAYGPASHSVQVDWIIPGRTYDFRLYPANNVTGAPLDVARVRGGAGSIAATPNPV